MNPNGRFMGLALKEALRGILKGEGGPFGACLVRRGRVVALAHNTVLVSRDSTNHAEVVAIRKASRRLKTHDLTGCEIYSTTEPCPMCFSAIHWAKIGKIYYGTRVEDVQRLGFNELSISNRTLKRIGGSPVRIIPEVSQAECLELLRRWRRLPHRKTY